MKLKLLRDWINTLPEEYMDYNCVYSVYEDSEDPEKGKWTRTDTIITSCYIDKGHTECSFSKNRPEALCQVPEQIKPLKKRKPKTKISSKI
jgi:hypothetical protein